MTRESFFAQFERHLLVGEPKREEIICEYQQHLSKLPPNADPALVLGNPAALAKALNRTHIGFFHSLRRLYVIPSLSIAIYAAMRIITSLLWKSNIDQRPFLGEVRDAEFMNAVIFPFLLAAMIGPALGHYQRPAKHFLLLSLSVFVTGSVLGMFTESLFILMGSWGTPMESLWIAFIMTVWCMGIASFSLFFNRMNSLNERTLTRRSLFRDVLIICFASLCIGLVTLLIGEQILRLFSLPPGSTAFPQVLAVMSGILFGLRRLFPYWKHARRQTTTTGSNVS